ncbi:MAG: MBOAT family protein [Lachnospiraceae bacterium]|nr:MBOAT family protein [Lachnospiraceae bacterium]
MVFSSLLFLFRFFPIVLILYVTIPAILSRMAFFREKKVRIQNLILFLSSLFFYAWGEPVYVLLMLFSTVVDYTHGLLVEYFLGKGKRGSAKLVVASSVIINLSLLGFFKYAKVVALPIGISFYTFQTMSYTIDVYRKDAKAQKNILDFGCYVAMFPQLIAGPIVQYKTIAEELKHRKVSLQDFSEGATRFILGLSKKVLLANNIGMLWEQVQALFLADGGASQEVGLLWWLGILAFALQIYYDFSGYSDMAIGMGRMFGFHFLENFDHPYEAASATEFWRRWHMSLGQWFRQYVYIPLGGNRHGLLIQMRNILIVWSLTGIWHGASWNFLCWGLYFGFFLVLEKTFLLGILNRFRGWGRIVPHLYTMVVVLLSWVIFAWEDLSFGLSYIQSMFLFGGVGDHLLYLLQSYGMLLGITLLGATRLPLRMGRFGMRWGRDHLPKGAVWMEVLQAGFLVALFLLSVAYIVDASYNPFLYFRF